MSVGAGVGQVPQGCRRDGSQGRRGGGRAWRRSVPPSSAPDPVRAAPMDYSARPASTSSSILTLLPTTTLPSSRAWLKLTPKSRRSISADGGEGDHGLALLHGRALAQVLEVELHRLGDATDGEVGGELPLAVGHLLEPGALQGDGGVVLGVEEVVRAQVVVAHRLVGVDAGRLDLGLQRGVLGVLGHREGAGELGEAAPDLGADQVAGHETDLGVGGVDGVGSCLGQGDRVSCSWGLLGCVR